MKNIINKRMIAIVILTIMLGLFFSIMTVSITGHMILERTVASAMYEFNGIYGGIGGQALDLAEHLPEFSWLVRINDICDITFGAAAAFTIPVTFITMMVEDWLLYTSFK